MKKNLLPYQENLKLAGRAAPFFIQSTYMP